MTLPPIHLSKNAISDLQAIYRRKYGEDLPDAEAWALGNRLVRLFAILTRPPAPEEPDDRFEPRPT